jgi:HSP20 family protein
MWIFATDLPGDTASVEPRKTPSRETAMSYLSYRNPFKAALHSWPNLDVEAYLRGLGPRVVWADLSAKTPDIRLDLSEDDGAYCVKADLPGVDKNDIELHVDGNTLHIAADMHRDTSPKQGCKDLYSERHHGKVGRTLSLPSNIDEAKATALYENGVLTLTLPKKSEGQTRRIAID